MTKSSNCEGRAIVSHLESALINPTASLLNITRKYDDLTAWSLWFSGIGVLKHYLVNGQKYNWALNVGPEEKNFLIPTDEEIRSPFCEYAVIRMCRYGQGTEYVNQFRSAEGNRAIIAEGKSELKKIENKIEKLRKKISEDPAEKVKLRHYEKQAHLTRKAIKALERNDEAQSNRANRKAARYDGINPDLALEASQTIVTLAFNPQMMSCFEYFHMVHKPFKDILGTERVESILGGFAKTVSEIGQKEYEEQFYDLWEACSADEQALVVLRFISNMYSSLSNHRNLPNRYGERKPDFFVQAEVLVNDKGEEHDTLEDYPESRNLCRGFSLNDGVSFPDEWTDVPVSLTVDGRITSVESTQPTVMTRRPWSACDELLERGKALLMMVKGNKRSKALTRSFEAFCTALEDGSFEEDGSFTLRPNYFRQNCNVDSSTSKTACNWIANDSIVWAKRNGVDYGLSIRWSKALESKARDLGSMYDSFFNSIIETAEKEVGTTCTNWTEKDNIHKFMCLTLRCFDNYLFHGGPVVDEMIVAKFYTEQASDRWALCEEEIEAHARTAYDMTEGLLQDAFEKKYRETFNENLPLTFTEYAKNQHDKKYGKKPERHDEKRTSFRGGVLCKSSDPNWCDDSDPVERARVINNELPAETVIMARYQAKQDEEKRMSDFNEKRLNDLLTIANKKK